MSSLVVGSVAFDTVETPFGRAENAMGGTAVYFSVAASLFTDVMLVGVVGDDFPESECAQLRDRGVDLRGLQLQHGETFRWVGEYGYDMNVAHTLDTQLNVFASFHPVLPDAYRDANFLFLGNIDPKLQMDVRRQVTSPRLVVLDTMNFWIEREPEPLLRVIREVDGVLMNEAEIRQLTGRHNLYDAARVLQEMGPRYIVAKRGEYGAVLFDRDDIFVAPAYPTWDVRDTTGAGDSFAGGFVGYLDRCGSLDHDSIRAAVVYGTVMASFTVEDFSLGGLLRATPESIDERYRRLARVSRIGEPSAFTLAALIPEGIQ